MESFNKGEKFKCAYIHNLLNNLENFLKSGFEYFDFNGIAEISGNAWFPQIPATFTLYQIIKFPYKKLYNS